MHALFVSVRARGVNPVRRACTEWLRPARLLYSSRASYVEDYDDASSSRKSGKNVKKPASVGTKQTVPRVDVATSSSSDVMNIGEEISGKIDKSDLNRILNEFYREGAVHQKAMERGLDEVKFFAAFNDFRRWCNEAEVLPDELHVVLSDMVQRREPGDVMKIYPYFISHAMRMFPHVIMREDLLKISDLRSPANWYPEARAMKRKVIFHAGPTNSGKTFSALQSFSKAKSGVYCGPLKLLANEVYHRTNALGTPCDLITGEERRLADQFNKLDDSAASQSQTNAKAEEGQRQSAHVACTVEMTSTSRHVDVAIIDEIQMIRDYQRGWAWTRALLGTPADEVHVCGEETAVDLVRDLVTEVGDEFHLNRYNRLTGLQFLNQAVGSFDRVRDGDCIVCFSRNDVFNVSHELERCGREVAIIYGSLPPATKLAQAAKFNDPNNPCKVLVSTDAIGMGLNLSIRRVVFYSLTKPVLVPKEDAESEGSYVKTLTAIGTSQALQIAGRAGRFNTQYPDGQVTTFRQEDVAELKRIVSRELAPVTQAGLHPTADQIELFAYHLPDASLSKLIDYFTELCQLDSARFFLCDVDNFKVIAEMLEHVPLGLRERYVFCTAPIDTRDTFMCTALVKYAVRCSREEPLTADWLKVALGGWPLPQPTSVRGLLHLESSFDALELYLWLGLRFPARFPDMTAVRQMQVELDDLIQRCVSMLTRLGRDRRVAGRSVDSDPPADSLFDREAALAKPRSVFANLRAAAQATDQQRISARGTPKVRRKPETTRSQEADSKKKKRDSVQRERTQQSARKLGGTGKISQRLINMGVLKPGELSKLQEELTALNGQSSEPSDGDKR